MELTTLQRMAVTFRQQGMEDEAIREILKLTCLKSGNNGDAISMVNTAMTGCTISRNIAEEVKNFVIVTSGDFSVTSCYNELHAVTKQEKTAIRVSILRLEQQKIIERTGRKNGIYRKINNECEAIDWLNTKSVALPIVWPMPFCLEQFVKIMPGNICLIAGSSDSGKTAMLLNMVLLNQHKFKIDYFSSEMGAMEFQERLSKFDYPIGDWKFNAKERAGDFADVIQSGEGHINIIDYLEIHEDFWKVSGMIKAIFDKLNGAVAIIALQKDSKASLGRGGSGTLEKPRLYLNMDAGKLKIVKAKNWVHGEVNPNGLIHDFRLIQGCKFIDAEPAKSWYKGD